jgi:hypothetical protein
VDAFRADTSNKLEKGEGRGLADSSKEESIHKKPAPLEEKKSSKT